MSEPTKSGFLALTVKMEKWAKEHIQLTLENGDLINVWVKKHGSGNNNFSKIVFECPKSIKINRVQPDSNGNS